MRPAPKGAAGVMLGLLLAVLGACTATPAPEPVPTDDRVGRSQATIEAVVGSDEVPGCSAAVGNDGEVVWQGVRGVAVEEPATPITPDTTFDIGSVSKQFTALAVATLADRGRLSLDDVVAEHLDGYPPWAEKVTLSQLIHHTGGVPDMDGLAVAAGVSGEMELSFDDVLQVIKEGATALEFEPGSRWAYTDTGYLLLAAIVEDVTHQPLAEYLQQTFFAPLDLTMTVGPPLQDPTRTRSYRAGANGRFEIIDTNADLRGASGIRATPTELVGWADNYRTGTVGGQLVTAPESTAVSGGFEDSRYGFGILISPDLTLWHSGDTGGFHTAFGVSADRAWALAVACNSVGLDPWTIFEPLGEIWGP
ncbi:MAG TPA: serine hydrolase domain-containing protein [Microlunatus sp.]